MKKTFPDGTQSPEEIVRDMLRKFERVGAGDIINTCRDAMREYLNGSGDTAVDNFTRHVYKQVMSSNHRRTPSIIRRIATGDMLERELLHEAWLKTSDGESVRLSAANAEVVQDFVERSYKNMSKVQNQHENTVRAADRLLSTMQRLNCTVERAYAELGLLIVEVTNKAPESADD